MNMKQLLLASLCAVAAPACAVTAVNPFGVNVRSSGPSTVLLSFQNLDPGETAAEAFWCGELQPSLMAANPQLQLPVPVQSSNPCLPGTLYGRLPLRLDRSRSSTRGSFSNLTDVMTIPASVARRAYQDAQAGLNSSFFYVRRFVGPAGERFVVVTCRMGGGGARTPLALLDVRLAFDTAGQRPTVLALERGQTPPRASARLLYNGSGTLRGRWEVVQPGDPEPSEDDLLTAATLPVEQRALQRRFTLLERFDIFLPPTGEVTLPGPDPARLPVALDGPYKVLLRVEASDDKEGQSNTGGGRVALGGGVAGFAMPVLRYHVGAGALPGTGVQGSSRSMVLLSPDAEASNEGRLTFAWVDPEGATLLQLEVRTQPAGAAAAPAVELLSAWVRPGVGRYEAPPWFVAAQKGQRLLWRVQAMDLQGAVLSASDWRAVELR
ncbi:MAG: hypothetical protein Q8R98_00195 [Rubrivivax sp.]|nr:hypothetical protein [Rubrivivax sp.]MDP3610250.1 hypothetical protein [Rubrivivax sp.]